MIKTSFKTNESEYAVTTGVCAAAAAKAAVIDLFQNRPVEEVMVDLPASRVAQIGVKKVGEPNQTIYAVQKPANDDPDITKNIVIFAEAKKSTKTLILGGEGIGTVTKPGLAISVGKPAINPVPLKMIENEITKVLPQNEAVEITISAPEGKIIAPKTFNERLGIVGGISILGTTGIVKPMSVEAYKVSLEQQIDIVRASGFSSVAIAPGNIGQKAALNRGFKKEAIILCSNFIGHALKQCQTKGVKEIAVIGHLGKLIKILDGSFNTHSNKSRINFDHLARFLDEGQVETLNSAEEAIGHLTKQAGSLNEIATSINQKISAFVDGEIKTSVTIINLQSEIVGESVKKHISSPLWEKIYR